MRSYIVRAVPLILLATLAACGDDEAASARIKKIEPGMTRDQALAEMGDGPLTAEGADSARVVHGYRHTRYLIDGKQFEVIYARDEAGKVTEALTSALETPIVIEGDKVIGKGWEYYTKTAMQQLRLPNPIVGVDSARPPAVTPNQDTTAAPAATPAATPPAKKP